MHKANTFIKWWMSKLQRFNFVFIFSGFICFVLLYLGAVIFNRPIYFFFMLPAVVVYVIFLNVLYIGIGLACNWSNKNPEDRNFGQRIFNIAIISSIALNVIALIVCLFGFQIINFY